MFATYVFVHVLFTHSIVGIVTHYRLDQIPVGGVPVPIQTHPGTPPTSYTMGSRALSPGVKQPGHGTNHSPTSSAKVKERVEIYLYSPSEPSCPVLG
jgi:hypothetical protein